MANLGAALITARPIVTGVVFVVRPIGGSVHLGAGQHVVLVHVMIPALHVVALLVEGRTLKDVRADVQIVEVDGDKLTTGTVPEDVPVSGMAASGRQKVMFCATGRNL